MPALVRRRARLFLQEAHQFRSATESEGALSVHGQQADPRLLCAFSTLEESLAATNIQRRLRGGHTRRLLRKAGNTVLGVGRFETLGGFVHVHEAQLQPTREVWPSETLVEREESLVLTG